jgi:predicted transcriptional regulator
VSDFFTRSGNYFAEIEESAERVWHDASLHVGDDFFGALATYLESRHGVRVSIREVNQMAGAVRRFDPEKRELALSEVLRRGSRNFQLAHQIGLLTGEESLRRLAGGADLASDSARALCRVALANYFAGAILMPYDAFLKAAEAERYDIDLLGHRFRSSFEQVCHRLTTLHRPNARGVPFYLLRIDIAGNVSKRFSPGALHFPRFSGLCPLWNVHAAFLRPGMMNVQLSRLPDGSTYFSVARTVRKHYGGYHARNVLYAIGLGCDLAFAKELVYSDGVDLAHPEAAVPVGITCRSCEREHCEARAFPSLRKPLRVDENARGVSFYASIKGE